MDAPAYNFKIGQLGTKAKRGEETVLSGTMSRQQQRDVKGKLKAHATVSPSWVMGGDTAMGTKPQAQDESYGELKTGSSPRLMGTLSSSSHPKALGKEMAEKNGSAWCVC